MFACTSLNMAVEPNCKSPTPLPEKKQTSVVQRIKNFFTKPAQLTKVVFLKDLALNKPGNCKYVQLKNRELFKHVRSLSLWSGMLLKRPHIKREFIFHDFADTMKFVNTVSEIAKKLNHYPKISIMKNKVLIVLRTNEVDGISTNDIELAKQIDGMLVSS